MKNEYNVTGLCEYLLFKDNNPYCTKCKCNNHSKKKVPILYQNKIVGKLYGCIKFHQIDIERSIVRMIK